MYKQIIAMGIASAAIMISAMFSTLAAEETAEIASMRETISEGAELYKRLGCTTCHGEDGNSPPKATFPKLKGKDADYLMERMEYLMSEEGSAAKRSAMHREYYSDEALAQCDEPPTRAQLELVAAWLASL